jgi:hypothetical protein
MAGFVDSLWGRSHLNEQGNEMMTTLFKRLAVLSLVGGLGACATVPPGVSTATPANGVAQKVDPQADAGVFFPPPTCAEIRVPLFRSNIDPGPENRQALTDQVNLAATTSAREVPIIAQAVGEGRRTLLFTQLEITGEPTPYLARALLARATFVIRYAPAIAEMGI